MGETVLDFDRLEALVPELRKEFAEAEPFPHVCLDDFLPRESAERTHREFDQTTGFNHYHHYNEKKEAMTELEALRPHTRELVEALHSPRFLDFIERITGVGDLLCDPDLDGAGLHQVGRGGFLNLHTDFLAHTKNRNWSRQINLLLYFNPDWKPEWKGDLELWDSDLTHCVRSVEPLFNRCVIFHTRAKSFHGHPHKLACPEGMTRKSLALYYFREESETRTLSPTNYRPRPEDSRVKKALIAADRTALWGYSMLKRYTGLSDGIVNRILKRF